MTTEALTPPAESQQLATQGQELVAAANRLVIADAEGFAYAGEVAKRLRIALKRAEEVLDPFVESAHRAWKTAVAHRDGIEKPYLDARRIVDAKIQEWDAEQRRLRREAEEAARREQERLEREAREQAEAEQRRLQAEAETKRLEEAAALEARGDREAADRLIAAPVVVAPVAPAPVFAPPPAVAEPPKVAGISFREEWSAEVVDFAQLVRASAEQRASLGLLLPNQTALNQMARALKGAFHVPGVKAVSRRITTGRA